MTRGNPPAHPHGGGASPDAGRWDTGHDPHDWASQLRGDTGEPSGWERQLRSSYQARPGRAERRRTSEQDESVRPAEPAGYGEPTPAAQGHHRYSSYPADDERHRGTGHRGQEPPQAPPVAPGVRRGHRAPGPEETYDQRTVVQDPYEARAVMSGAYERRAVVQDDPYAPRAHAHEAGHGRGHPDDDPYSGAQHYAGPPPRHESRGHDWDEMPEADQATVYQPRRTGEEYPYEPDVENGQSEHDDPRREEPAGLDVITGSFGTVEEPEGTRVARRRHRKQKGRDRRRSLTAMIVVVTVFIGLVGVGVLGYSKIREFLIPPDYDGTGSGTVTIQIKPGDSARSIGNSLVRAGVVKSSEAFVNAAEEEPRSTSLQPGTYKLRKKMAASEALKLLLDPKSKVSNKLTIHEGLSIKRTLARISKQLGMPLEELEQAASDPKALGVPDWANGNLEGFLFPDTYEIQPDTSAFQLLKAMVQRANQVFVEIDFVNKARERGFEPYNVLTIASLIEGEGITSDFRKISRVVYNRLEADMRLQFDSTTQYWLELTGRDRQHRLTDDDLKDPENSYSTTTRRGLPPTAIANPGKTALEAALNPEEGDWLYFVVIDEDRNSAFTADLGEHNRNVQICKEKNLGC